MIKEESFSKEWILSFRSKPEYSKAHPELMEKMIYALYLVELLKYNGLNFIFKGGTCLTIMFPELRRFSIDVDIVTEQDKADIEEVLSKIIKESRFSKFELDEKRSFKNDFPKAHYYIYFKSFYDGSEKSILLDVLFDKNPYKIINSIPIENDFLCRDNTPVQVSVPSCNDIAADKLTAFAPSTIGIPYGIGKELQIIKQLFDVGFLYNSIDDLTILNETFIKISESQCCYRNINFSIEDILSDTINTAFILAMQNRNRNEAKRKYNELVAGIGSFNSFLPNARFNIYDAIEYSSKAALLAAKLKSANYEPLPIMEYASYKHSDFPIPIGIYQPVSKMIKAFPNLSHFYWYHIAEILHN